MPWCTRPTQPTEWLIVAGVLGVLAVLAVFELTALARQRRAHEAVLGLADMFHGVAAYFSEDRPDAGLTGLPAHRCPHHPDHPFAGELGPTPSLDLRCGDGPHGRCWPRQGQTGPGVYELAAWTQDPVWREIGFRHTGGHNFHYSYSYRNEPTLDGYGRCTFTVRAVADLDGNGVWSLYERRGLADRSGVRAEGGLRSERPFD